MNKFLFRLKVLGAMAYLAFLFWVPPAGAVISNFPRFKRLVAEDTLEQYAVWIKALRMGVRAFIKGDQLTFKERTK